MEVDIALACIVETFLEPPAYLYEDDTEGILKLVIDQMDDTSDDRQEIPAVESYVEHIIPSLSSGEFKSQFRMLPSTFELILSDVGKELIRTTDGNRMIPADKQLLLSLWRFATSDSYRQVLLIPHPQRKWANGGPPVAHFLCGSIIQRFNVGKATALRSVRRTAKALCELAPKYIMWPTENAVQDIVHGFSCISGFPDVIGAIDNTHINIPTSNKNTEAYVDQKGHHSIHLQAICDHTGKFTHVYIGNMNSVDDANVLNLSSLQEFINDSNKFPKNTHLIGDAAYKLHQHLLVPYSDNEHLTKRQKNYNYCQSSSQIVVEKAFALLKGRWRSLLNILAINRMDFTPYHILACCVLHNVCLLNEDELEPENEVIIIDVGETKMHERRIEYNSQKTIAEAKRNKICANLCVIHEN